LHSFFYPYGKYKRENIKMQKISVLLPNLFSMCTYWADCKLPDGTFVQVPFGKTKQTGVVWNEPADETLPQEKIKNIDCVCDLPPLSSKIMRFMDWVSDYTLSAKGMILKMLIPIDVLENSKKPIVFEKPIISNASLHFSDEQQQAINTITPKIKESFSVTLIDGVTGSGKTAVYFEAIE